MVAVIAVREGNNRALIELNELIPGHCGTTGFNLVGNAINPAGDGGIEDHSSHRLVKVAIYSKIEHCSSRWLRIREGKRQFYLTGLFKLLLVDERSFSGLCLV